MYVQEEFKKNNNYYSSGYNPHLNIYINVQYMVQQYMHM